MKILLQQAIQVVDGGCAPFQIFKYLDSLDVEDFQGC
jgi:hypothetical protein